MQNKIRGKKSGRQKFGVTVNTSFEIVIYNSNIVSSGSEITPCIKINTDFRVHVKL